MVCKEIQYNNLSEKEKQQIVTEINILKDIKHNNIVQYYDKIQDKTNSKIYILMEYCNGGDLQNYLNQIKKNNQCIPEDSIWTIIS